MPSCLEICCLRGSTKARQIELDEHHPDFRCEKSHCSCFSPGLVENDEVVIFLLVDPIHYDEERKTVVPQAFRELTNRDLSVLRLSYANAEELAELQAKLVQRSEERDIREVCRVRVHELRATKDDSGRMLGVLDTALESNIAHASVVTSADHLLSKGKRAEVLRRIHEILSSEIVLLKDVYKNLG